jgi:HlyD family secretion protein
MTYRSEEFETTPPKSRNTRAVQLVFLLAIVATAAAALAYREPLWGRVTRVLATTNEEPIPTQNLERVSFRLETPAVGEIIGLETVPVPTPSTRGGGLKIAWLIPEGSFIKPGDTVVRFDSTDAQLNLEQQQNTLEANQERTKITTGKQTTDEKVLGIDRTDAEKEYQHAMTVMPQDETIFSKWDIIEAKINAGFAKERINFLSNKGRVQKRIARADQQILVIEKNKARAEISVAQQTLDSLELRAPKGGLVLYRRDRMREPQVGEESWPGQVLVEVVDLHALQARIYVLERDAAGLAQDKEVTIRLDSIPDKTFQGTIRSVASLAQTLERNSPLKYFACQVTIADAYEDMPRIKPGMSLEADVILEKYDSCFVVPASAVTLKGAEALVHVKQGDRFVPRPVTIGTGTHGQSVVLSGVKDNETIAMRNPFETRKAHLPDFSKASAPGSGMGGGMRIMIR